MEGRNLNIVVYVSAVCTVHKSAASHVQISDHRGLLQGTDQDARRRRAALGGDGDGVAPDFDLASLFPGAATGGEGGDPDASGDDEEHVARAYAAQRLLDGSQVITKANHSSERQSSSHRGASC